MRYLSVVVLAALVGGCAVSPPMQTATTADREPASARVDAESQVLQSPLPLAMLCPSLDPREATCGARTPPAETDHNDTSAVAATTDLWSRLREGLAMNPCAAGPEVHRSAARFARNPAVFEATLARTLPLIQFVAEQVLQRGLPSELVWIPMVESSYIPLPARRNLAGMWQIARITSGELDLRRDLDYDARVDPISSTRAALDLLQHLHSQLEQDWYLTILGYNAGEFAVKAAIRGRAELQTPAELNTLGLRPVTYGHLRRTLALSCIMAEPERFAVTLPDFEDLDPLQQVRLEHPLDLRLAARLAGIDDEQLVVLNRGFLQPWTPALGPHRLLLPRSAANRLNFELARLPSPWWSGWVWHALSADTPLAELPNDANVPLSLLARVNGLDSVATRLPRGGRALIHQPGMQEQRTAAAEQSALEAVTHRVQSGDSLWRLSRQYKVSIADLRRWNQLGSSSTLRIGQTLIVAHRSAAETQTPAQGSYRVRPRDSIWLIARRYGLRADELMRWNRISDPEQLRVGQTLRLSPPLAAAAGALVELPGVELNP